MKIKYFFFFDDGYDENKDDDDDVCDPLSNSKIHFSFYGIFISLFFYSNSKTFSHSHSARIHSKQQ
jgi:hypothetical protein